MIDNKENNAIEKAENLSEDTQKVKGNDFANTNLNTNHIYQNEGAQKSKISAEEQKRELERQKYHFERQKEEAKRARMQKDNQKGGKKSSNKVTGWVAAVVTLSCLCLVLATLLVHNQYMSGGGESRLSNHYARSFYDFCDYIDNIDVNLSKLTTSHDDENKQKILVDICVQANLAEADLVDLPLKEESKNSTVKFVNQLGDFSKYLNNKLIGGDSISKEDMSTLYEMKKINSSLREKLSKLSLSLGEDFNFITLLSGEENALIDGFTEIESHSVEYPKMIYDGPFADEEETSNKIEDSAEKEVSKEQIIENFKRIFADYSPKEVTVSGMASGKGGKVYNVEAKMDNYDLFAQFKTDGKLLLFDSYTKSENKNYTRDQCIDNAYKFLEKCGYKSIKAVWSTSKKDNMVYINFAGCDKRGEIIYYADLIKVGVCRDSGRVCDMDARTYLDAPKERENFQPKIKVEDAERVASKDIEVKFARLAVIPVTQKTERLAYEFYGENEEGSFYIYVDALTGKELKIFKVITTEEGDLLL